MFKAFVKLSSLAWPWMVNISPGEVRGESLALVCAQFGAPGPSGPAGSCIEVLQPGPAGPGEDLGLSLLHALLTCLLNYRLRMRDENPNAATSRSIRYRVTKGFFARIFMQHTLEFYSNLHSNCKASCGSLAEMSTACWLNCE